MLEWNKTLAGEVIDQILELSAEAQIQRRAVAKGSAAFQKLTGAIAAYGKVLALLTALRQREKFYTMLVNPTCWTASQQVS